MSGRMSAVILVSPGSPHRGPTFEQVLAACGPRPLVVLHNAWQDWFSAEFSLELPQTWTNASVHSLVQAYLADHGLTLCGIVCYDDWHLELSAYLWENLPIEQPPAYPFNVISQIRDKARFRQICNGLGDVISIGCWNIDEHSSIPESSFPVVIKPNKGAGSYNCKKIDSPLELAEYVAFLRNSVDSRRPEFNNFIIEQLVTGVEFDLDGYCRDSKIVHSLASRNTESDQNCNEMGGLYPGNFETHAVDKINNALQAILDFFGASITTIFHFEGIYNAEKNAVFPIELNMRIGGAEAPICFERLTGIRIGELAVNLATGSELPHPIESQGFIRSIPIYSDGNGKVGKIQIQPELFSHPWHAWHAMYATEGLEMTPARTGSQRILYIVAASGGSPEEAEEHVKELLQYIAVEFTPTDPDCRCVRQA